MYALIIEAAVETAKFPTAFCFIIMSYLYAMETIPCSCV